MPMGRRRYNIGTFLICVGECLVVCKYIIAKPFGRELIVSDVPIEPLAWSGVIMGILLLV